MWGGAGTDLDYRSCAGGGLIINPQHLQCLQHLLPSPGQADAPLHRQTVVGAVVKALHGGIIVDGNQVFPLQKLKRRGRILRQSFFQTVGLHGVHSPGNWQKGILPQYLQNLQLAFGHQQSATAAGTACASAAIAAAGLMFSAHDFSSSNEVFPCFQGVFP